jgi:hypothetical protein
LFGLHPLEPHTPPLQALGLQQVALVPVPQQTSPAEQHWPLQQSLALQQVVPPQQMPSVQQVPSLQHDPAEQQVPLQQSSLASGQQWPLQHLPVMQSESV